MNRLVALLLAFTLLLVPLPCWGAERIAHRATAVAEIKKLGGKVTVAKKEYD